MPIIVEEEISIEELPQFEVKDEVFEKVQEDIENEIAVLEVIKTHKLEVVTDAHKDLELLQKAEDIKKIPLE